MADGDSLPEEDHIIRHLSPTKFDDTEDGIRPYFEAFEPRDQETEPSVNWVEYDGQRDLAIAVPAAINLIERTVKSSHRFPKLNIGKLKSNVYNESSENRNVDVLHRPREGNSSHAGISNIRPYDSEISEIIADCIETWHDPDGNTVA